MHFTAQNRTQRGDPIELNFEGLEMQEQNKPTDKAQKENEKSRTICLVNMFTPRGIVIKMSKMAYFCIFC